MPLKGKGIEINKVGDYMVLYTISSGIWVGNGANRKFISNRDEKNEMIKVFAKNTNAAKSLAFQQIHRSPNEFVKVIKAIPIPKKEEKKVV